MVDEDRKVIAPKNPLVEHPHDRSAVHKIVVFLKKNDWANVLVTMVVDVRINIFVTNQKPAWYNGYFNFLIL